MSNVLLRNVNPLGYVDLPILGRVGPADDDTADEPGVGCLHPGEEFPCPAEIAGRAPGVIAAVGEPGDENYQPESYDPGVGLLAQVGNFELVEGDEFTGKTIDELKAIAAERDIDLAGATKKSDILKVLRAQA